MAEWALFTGLREFEICALRLSQIPSQDSYRGRLTALIHVTETKFSKAADLRVPAWLLDKTYQYIAFFGRPAIVRAARRRGAPAAPDNIFLARWGTALKPDSVYNRFKEALTELDIAGTFHDLRHTFAICTLDSLMRSERYASTRGMEAFFVLQGRMRRERMSSTMIYLRAREFYLDDIDSGLWDLPVSEAEVS
jgi:integrase